MIPYTKLTLTNQQLYTKLIDRQLVIPVEDKSVVFETLDKLGYYRFTGFCLPFVQTTANNRKIFVAGTTIHKILALYKFDTSLRSLASQALEKIEIALASSICNTLCGKHESLWYTKEDIFFDKQTHQKILEVAAKTMKFDLAANKGHTKNPNEYLKHYYSKYSPPGLPPAWMLRECASFGFWSNAYKGLKKAEQTSISNAWKYPNKKIILPAVFESWLHTLSVFRNRCAHHNRITHTTLPYSPKTPDNVPAAQRFPAPDSNGFSTTNDLRTFFLIIDILLRTAAPAYDWKAKLREQFTIAAADGVTISKAAGFKFDWENDIFWSEWTSHLQVV